MRSLLEKSICLSWSFLASKDAWLNETHNRKVHRSQPSKTVCVRHARKLHEPNQHLHRPRTSIRDQTLRHPSPDELHLRQPFYEERRRNLDAYLHPWNIRGVYFAHIHQILYHKLRHCDRLHGPQQLLWVQGTGWRNILGYTWQREWKKRWKYYQKWK